MKNWKKKTIALFLLSAMVLMMFAGCADSEATGENPQPAEEEAAQELDTSVETVEAETMSYDELVAEAQKEGKVVVYSITSRISTAAEAFTAKYGIEVEAANLKDFEMIEKVSKEASLGIEGADFIIAQDSGRVFGELIRPGYVVNYVPESMKDIIPEAYQEPLVFSFINKIFTYNSETYDGTPIDNAWALTDPANEGKFFFKNPFLEGVNSNFLTMLTRDDLSAELAAAYEDYYGKPLELTTKNAGYEWMKMVFENGLVLVTSDSKMAESIGVKGEGIESIGLGTYSKLRYKETKNLAIDGIFDVKPFTGFYYPTYMLMMKDATHPHAAKLFMEYLLTEDGFAPWSKDIGTYSSNPNIPIQENDYPVEFWEKVMVTEDPEFIFNNRADVEEFLNQYIY